jgi:membrane-associated PAP2 superfamily phosphatase
MALISSLLIRRNSNHPPLFLGGWLRYLMLPLWVLTVLFILSYGTGLDETLAAIWFELQGKQWSLKTYWLTETVLHQTVRQLNLCVLLLMIVYWLVKFFLHPQTAILRALGVLLLSIICSVATIALLKRLIPMECPWDLQAFGGTQTWFGLFSDRPSSMRSNQCFPAGHASIGYSWLAIYFFFKLLRPRLALTGLLCSIGVGLILGFTQQLRGAHFLSHDIATAAICWTVAVVVFRSFYPWHELQTSADFDGANLAHSSVSAAPSAAIICPHHASKEYSDV